MQLPEALPADDAQQGAADVDGKTADGDGAARPKSGSRVGGEAGGGKAVAGSNTKAEQWLGNRNALSVAAEIVSNNITVSLATGISSIIKPIDALHGWALKQGHDPALCLDWHVKMSRLDYGIVWTTMDAILEPHMLNKLGLQPPASAEPCWLHDDKAATDIADSLFCYSRELVASEILFQMLYSLV